MTPEQVGLLAESWNAVAGRREEIARAFYQLLFARHPGLRPLFARTDDFVGAIALFWEHPEDR